MQRRVFDQEKAGDLRAYVVWVPMFRGMERDVARASAEVPDPRARHYWDGESRLMKGYQETLQLAEPAWDIFLLYDRDARWEGDRPPVPAYWMHQLGSEDEPRVPGPYLDGPVFLERLRQVLGPAGR